MAEQRSSKAVIKNSDMSVFVVVVVVVVITTKIAVISVADGR